VILQVVRGPGGTDRDFDRLSFIGQMADGDLLLALAGLCRIGNEEAASCDA